MREGLDREPTLHELEIIECMRELLQPIPALTCRYSRQTILMALLTHAGAGLRDLLTKGEYSRTEIERICRDFRVLALGAHADTRRTECALH